MSSLATNHTTTSIKTGFVDGPSTRGTLNIIWTCLSVLLLCTWSVVHPNVPAQIVVRNRKEAFVRMLGSFTHKLVWMIFNLLAPEWTFAKALVDFQSVRMLGELKTQALRDGVPWSNTHTYFANMGGFGIKFEESHDIEVTVKYCNESHEPHFLDWERDTNQGLRQAVNRNLLVMANIHIKKRQPKGIIAEVDDLNWKLAQQALLCIHAVWVPEQWQKDRCQMKDILAPNLAWLRTNIWVLDAYQLLTARKLGIIDKLPDVTEADLKDRNKDDMAMKLLLVGQMCWFIVQMIIRLSRGTTTSQLEVMTLAFCIATVVSYILLLDKPKDVEQTIIVPANRRPQAPSEMVQVAVVGPSYYLLSIMRSTVWIPDTALPFLNQRIGEGDLIAFGLSIILVIFGIVHCISWNFVYPSDLEKLIWQMSSIMTIGAPFCMWLAHIITWRVPENSPWFGFVSKTSQGSSLILMMLFFAARIFIIVEVFRSLAFLPLEAFTVTTISGFPHIS